MKLSFNSKIFLAIAIPVLGSLTVALIGAYGFTSSNQKLQNFVENVSPQKDHVFTMRYHLMALSIFERRYVWEAKVDERRQIAERMKEEHHKLMALVDLVGQYETIANREEFEKEKKFFNAWWDNDLEVRKAADSARYELAASLVSGRGQEYMEAAVQGVNALVELNNKETDKSVREAIAGNGIFRGLLFFVTIGVMLIGIAFGMNLVRIVRYCMEIMGTQLRANSVEVEEISNQVANASQKLSQANTQQAASLQETAASAEELTAMVIRNQENAQQASVLVDSSHNNAQKGQRVVQEMARAISEINASNQEIMNEVFESNRKISEITRVIAEIGNKTKVINDIVFQTKLLSFNASVEAARAGEHGRGFAVVAEEVGNLAAMSGLAAKEISDMLDSSIQKVENIVGETRSNVERLVLVGKQKVDTGTQIVAQCSEVLEDIVSSVTQVNAMSRDISLASDEQARGVREISHAVSQLDAVVHTNAVSAEQASRAADILNVQAKTLQNALQELLDYMNGEASMSDDDGGTVVKSVQTRGGSGSVVQNSPVVPPALKVVPKNSGAAAAKPKSAPVASKPDQSSALKLASGGDQQIPSADDPRFKDI
jgi:methyl-accepting chemotaxis protein